MVEYSQPFVNYLIASHGLWLSHEGGCRANFSFVYLEGKRFVDARLQRAIFTCAQLERAKFDRARLTRADFQQANLQGASFRGACLIRTDFRNADMRNVNLTDTDVTDAYLQGACFASPDGKIYRVA